MEISASDIRFRKAEEKDIEGIKKLINSRWDRKVDEKELKNRVNDGIEFVAVLNQREGKQEKVIGQMSGIITKDFKPSWSEHIGYGNIKERMDKKGDKLTLYQLTVDPDVKVKDVRIAHELRKQHLDHAKTIGETVVNGFSAFMGRYKGLEIRTHSPIQDLNKMLFKNAEFKSYIEEKFNVKLKDEKSFLRLPKKTQERIAMERLYHTESLFKKSDMDIKRDKNGEIISATHKNEKENEKLTKKLSEFQELTKNMIDGEKLKWRLLQGSIDNKPGAFQRFKNKNRSLIKKLYKGRKFGIEEYFQLLGRKPEDTLRFHVSGGARIDKIYAGGSEEKHRGLGIAVSYVYQK